MKTNRPLANLIPQIISHVKNHYQSHVVYNGKLIDISNGNLLPYVEQSMRGELNPRAFERSRQRIPPINLLNKLQVKLSKVYGETPVRNCGQNKTDKDLLNYYVENWDLDESLQYANDLLIINKYCALEPYYLDGSPQLRVLSAKDFIVYSDSQTNPTEPTVFIKFMGMVSKEDALNKRINQVSLFHAYSDDEFIIFDEDQIVYENIENPYGIIPFIYLRSDKNQLIPTPDSDNLPMTVLIPKLMADLNYAVMFGCRSQVVGIDVEMDNVEMSPDSLWIVSSQSGEGKNPSISTIKSDVDVDKVLNLINNELGLWLDTKGIKTSSVGRVSIEQAASGISKLIDESDSTAVNRKYKKIFQNAENKLWKILPELHSVWTRNNETDMKKLFSTQFKVAVELLDSKIIPNKNELLNEMKLENELGIFNKLDGLKRLYPLATEAEIQLKLNSLEVPNVINQEE